MRNPYQVLGVPRDADADTIKKRYKQLARQYHPDVNKSADAPERFKEVNAAYDVLGDADKRKAYDQFGEASTRPGFDPRAGAGGFGGFGGFDFGGGPVDMDDVLGSIFGAGGAGGFRGPRRGRDLHARLTVDAMLAIRGGETQLRIERPDGTTDNLKVRVPAGVRDGGKLRLAGQGHPPPGGGPCGDLVVELQIPEHPVLKREGDDLELEVPISVLEAIAGATITVPTPTGDVHVTVPAGAQNGQRLRVKGRGVQKQGEPGHLYLVLRPMLPSQTNDEVLAAARTLEAAYEGDLRASLRI